MSHRRSFTWSVAIAALMAGGMLLLRGEGTPPTADPERIEALQAAFRKPPTSARPWVFWYWMHGAVSREGITADLTAMRDAGIAGADLFTIGEPTNPPEFAPPLNPLTPEWWNLVRHAANEADRLGLELGLDVGDGFATAGGPWITPELAMQKVVWSTTSVVGGRAFDGTLPQPPTKEGFYRDIAVLAFPTPEGESVSTKSVPVTVTTSLPGFDAQFLASGGDGERQLRTDALCWIQYEFAEPFTLRSLVIRQWDRNFAGVYFATRLKIEASDDGATFRSVGRLEPPRHGWQDWDADYTFSIPAVTARYFRFVHDPTDADAGAEDLNGAKWKPRLLLRGLVLSSAVRIPGFEGKSGAVWRIAARANDDVVPPNRCVPLVHIIDLTDKLGADGRLAWTPPVAAWTILRVGYTPTGHRNETGGAARGLECDKFNPAAARTQFEHWFGEAVRHLGPDLARRVLRVFHVDSWEAGSQNWSPVFGAEFRRRRGYDLRAYLPAMAGYPIQDAATSERFLHDIRQTITDLTNENFFGTLANLAHEQGCAFSAEATAPTMIGDGMAHFAQADIPMGEFWLRSPTHDKPNDIADAVSGAHIYGRRIVQAEAFTELRNQWDEHPGLLKKLGDHEFALGINRLVLHVFTHNPWLDRRPGMTLGGVGVAFQRDQMWWKDARAWTDYLSRCQVLLQAGQPVADVAYFTGDELPRRALLPSREQPALPAGYAADSINPDALLRLASLRDGQLVLPGGAHYRALVVPPSRPYSPEIARKLQELHALVVAQGESLAKALDRANVPPDLLADESDQPAADSEWKHRTAADADIYFLSNQREAERELRVSVRDTGRRLAELWDPLTGEIRPARVERRDGRVNVTVRLAPHGSHFLILRDGSAGPETVAPTRNWRDYESLVALEGPWTVQFSTGFGGPEAPVAFSRLLDWTRHEDPRIRAYSGTASYRCAFTWAHPDRRRVWLDLGDVRNLAHVFVNGVDCGVAWTSPHRIEITSALRQGSNELEIAVTNTWANRLAADRTAKSPLTWTTAPRDVAKPQPAGLLGPVRLLIER